MEKENKIENGCKIFCIFFKNENYSGNEMLEKIAKIGGTGNYYTTKNLIELCKVFEKINEAIENNCRLKIKKSTFIYDK